MVFFVHGEDEVVEHLKNSVQEVFSKREIDVKVVVDVEESKAIDMVAKSTTPFNITQLVGKYRFTINKFDKDKQIVFIRVPSQIAMMRILKTIVNKDLDKDVKQKQYELIHNELKDIDYKTKYNPYCIVFENKDLQGEGMDLIKAYDNDVMKRNVSNLTIIRMMDAYKGEREVGKKTELSRKRMNLIAFNILCKYLRLIKHPLLDQIVKKQQKRLAMKRKKKAKAKGIELKKKGGKKHVNKKFNKGTNKGTRDKNKQHKGMGKSNKPYNKGKPGGSKPSGYVRKPGNKPNVQRRSPNTDKRDRS